MTTTYTATCPEIHCDGCAASIQRVLGRLAGVQHIEVDIEKRQVRAEYDNRQVNPETIQERLTQAGFPPESG